MTKLLIVESLACLVLFASAGNAKADPLETQTGKVTCGTAGCTPVAFPLGFGSPPRISFSAFPGCDVNIRRVTRHGFEVERRNDFGHPFTCAYTAKGSYFLHNLSVAKYLVLSVIYAPPGRSVNSVTYSSSSMAGTSVSSSKTFTSANSVSVGASGSVIVGGSANASFDASRSTTDTEILDIKKTTTTTIIRPGPAQDGIDHDEDQIWLLLSPPIDIGINPNISPAAISWQLGTNANKALITYLYVGQLNGHYLIPRGQQDLLDGAGITPSDFPDILARDPLAGDHPYFDPDRFIPLEPRSTVIYTPPLRPTDPNIPIASTFNTTATSTSSSSVDDTYRVTLSLGADVDFFSLAQVNMKDTQTWTWSNKATNTSSTSTSDTIGYTRTL